MDILTFYPDQGSIVGIRTGNEGIIIDAHMPKCGYVTPGEIQQSLSIYFRGITIRGLVLTASTRIMLIRPVWSGFSTSSYWTGSCKQWGVIGAAAGPLGVEIAMRLLKACCSSERFVEQRSATKNAPRESQMATDS